MIHDLFGPILDVGQRMQKWLGFIVVAKNNKGMYEQVSIPFQTRAGAASFMALYQQYHPTAGCFIRELRTNDKGEGLEDRGPP